MGIKLMLSYLFNRQRAIFLFEVRIGLLSLLNLSRKKTGSLFVLYAEECKSFSMHCLALSKYSKGVNVINSFLTSETQELQYAWLYCELPNIGVV